MRKWIMLAVIIVIIGLGWLVFYQVAVFHLTGTQPSNGSKNFPTYQEVDFHFNQPLSTSHGDNTVTLGPAGSTQVSGKEVSFVPSLPLTDGQSYSITLSNITSSNGKHLSPITIKFTAKYVPLSQLPKSIQQRYTDRQDQNYDSQTPLNKLLATLPHPTNLYTLTYISVDSTFVIQVNTADVAGDEAAAKAYIQSFGVDPSSVKISYSIPAIYQ